MFTPGFSIIERKQFEDCLVRSHQIRIGVTLLDMNMDPAPGLSDISKYLIDGQVTVSAAADVSTRTLNATFLDPKSDLRLDSGSPDDGILYADRMVRITYEVFVPEVARIDKWMAIPIFTGPITKFDRDGATVTLEGSGKETLAGTVWKTYSIPDKTNKISAIRQILRYAGEDFFGDLGTTTTTISGAKAGVSFPKPQSTSTSTTEAETTVMWSQAEDIAQSLNRVLYYDGLGYVNMKEVSDISVFTFFDGPDGTVQKQPQITFDPTMLYNVVRVDGKVPKSGSAPSYTAIAPPDHPLSPERLGRYIDRVGGVGGTLVPRYLADIRQSDDYTTLAEVTAAAKSSLKERLDQSIELNFDSLVIPHLEMNDWCTLHTTNPAINTEFKLRNFMIPLNASGVMTIGYTKNQTINVSDIRLRGTF